jgi:hypothetical protein
LTQKGGGTMRAVILLRANPGFQERAYEALKGIAVEGVRIESIAHCFGRFDGVITCSYEHMGNLNKLGELLRKKGVFHTETLIGIE